MTNADKIRMMKDEEIATMLSLSCPVNKVCPHLGTRIHQTVCFECWLKWLKQLAEDT